MTNPFQDWRNPSRPNMWEKDYFKRDHVQAISRCIEAWNDGLITTQELVCNIEFQYLLGYEKGLEDAHFPVPAIPPQVYEHKRRNPHVTLQGALTLNTYLSQIT